jgi:NADPH2 dehydrogenase
MEEGMVLATLPSTRSLEHTLYKVADAVHAKGSHMYLQLWALGLAASVEQLKKEDPFFEYFSAGDAPLSKTPQQQ